MEEDSEALLPLPTRQHPPGQCRHGVKLRDHCQPCMIAWYSKPVPRLVPLGDALLDGAFCE